MLTSKKEESSQVNSLTKHPKELKKENETQQRSDKKEI